MRDGLTVFLIFSIFFVYKDVHKKENINAIILIYLANIFALVLVFYTAVEWLKVEINLFGGVAAIIFSISYNFIQKNNSSNDMHMSFKSFMTFILVYVSIALITLGVEYFAFNTNSCSLVLITMLTLQIIVNYFIRFIFVNKV